LPRGVHPHRLTDEITAVSCGAPGSCLGVGVSLNDGGNARRQDGFSLAFTPSSPDPIAQTPASVAFSVSCPTAALCLVGGGGSVRRFTR
jgi:hypothetical protein